MLMQIADTFERPSSKSCYWIFKIWSLKFKILPGVVACTCKSATLETEYWNGVGSIPVRGNSSSIGGWIVWPPVIQHRVRSMTKYWALIRPNSELRFQDGLN